MVTWVWDDGGDYWCFVIVWPDQRRRFYEERGHASRTEAEGQLDTMLEHYRKNA